MKGGRADAVIALLLVGVLVLPATNMRVQALGVSRSKATLGGTLQTTRGVRCPTALPVGRNALQGVIADVGREIGQYFVQARRGYQVLAVIFLRSSSSGYHLGAEQHALIAGFCGAMIANRSWYVYVSFPFHDVNAVPRGEMYLARTRKGWRIWFSPATS